MRYSFTIMTAHGDVQVAFGPNHHIGAVLTETLLRVGVPVSPQDYDLVDSEGNPLKLDWTIGGSELEDGEELRLEPNPVMI